MASLYSAENTRRRGWSPRGPPEELTTPSSGRRPRVSAIVKVTRIDHPVSPCSWLRSHAHGVSNSTLTERGDAIHPIRNQVLSRAALTLLTPPLPDESTEQLLGRISAGST